LRHAIPDSPVQTTAILQYQTLKSTNAITLVDFDSYPPIENTGRVKFYAMMTCTIFLILFLFETFGKGLPDWVALVTLTTGAFGLIVGAAVAGTLPIYLIQSGKTKDAQRLAAINAKFMTLTFPIALDTAAAYITVARAARANADPELAFLTAHYAIRICKSFALQAEEAAKIIKNKSVSDLRLQYAKTVKFVQPEAELLIAWTLLEVGKDSDALMMGTRSAANWQAALAEPPPKGQVTISVTRQGAFAQMANAYELLGVIAAKQNDAELCNAHFNDAYEILKNNDLLGTESERNFYLNKGYAFLLLGAPEDAKRESETALNLNAKTKITDTSRATIYTNLGEACRQLGMHEEADDYLNKSIAVKLKLYPPNHHELTESEGYLKLLRG